MHTRPLLPYILGLFSPSTRSLLPSFWLLSLPLSSSLFSAFRFFPGKKLAQKSEPIFFTVCKSISTHFRESDTGALCVGVIDRVLCVCVCVCVWVFVCVCVCVCDKN
jgi:hypothetical protein